MKRGFIIASHSTFSAGLTAALKFFAGDNLNIEVVTAYVTNKPVDDELQQVVSQFSVDDELVILTDLMAGSVNQKAVLYLQRPHTHLVTGMNLPLALALLMEPSEHYLSGERVHELVEAARQQIVYMNEINLGEADDNDE